jgi:hypothetical protein
MARSLLSNGYKLSVAQKWELSTGQPRTEPYPDRIEIEKGYELETSDDLLPVVDAEMPQFRL